MNTKITNYFLSWKIKIILTLILLFTAINSTTQNILFVKTCPGPSFYCLAHSYLAGLSVANHYFVAKYEIDGKYLERGLFSTILRWPEQETLGCWPRDGPTFANTREVKSWWCSGKNANCPGQGANLMSVEKYSIRLYKDPCIYLFQYIFDPKY